MTNFNMLANAVSSTTANSISGNHGTLVHKWKLPTAVWAHATLQSFLLNGSDNLGAGVWVSQFTDATGAHNVQDIGLFRENCTSVTYTIGVGISFASALCITQFFPD